MFFQYFYVFAICNILRDRRTRGRLGGEDSVILTEEQIVDMLAKGNQVKRPPGLTQDQWIYVNLLLGYNAVREFSEIVENNCHCQTVSVSHSYTFTIEEGQSYPCAMLVSPYVFVHLTLSLAVAMISCLENKHPTEAERHVRDEMINSVFNKYVIAMAHYLWRHEQVFKLAGILKQFECTLCHFVEFAVDAKLLNQEVFNAVMLTLDMKIIEREHQRLADEEQKSIEELEQLVELLQFKNIDEKIWSSRRGKRLLLSNQLDPSQH